MKNFTDSDINVFEWLIERDYYINYYLDSLPAGLNRTKTVIQNTSYVSYNQGIPIGFKRNGIWYIYNHYNLHVHLNEKNVLTCLVTESDDNYKDYEEHKGKSYTMERIPTINLMGIKYLLPMVGGRIDGYYEIEHMALQRSFCGAR